VTRGMEIIEKKKKKITRFLISRSALDILPGRVDSRLRSKFQGLMGLYSRYGRIEEKKG
jgi:hypothetical protein